MVLPLLVAITIGLVWLLSLAVTQVRVVDAARETARALARDDSQAHAIGLGQTAAPDSRIDIARDGGQVRVTVSTVSRGPGGLFARWGAVTISATAVSAVEEGR